MAHQKKTQFGSVLKQCNVSYPIACTPLTMVMDMNSNVNMLLIVIKGWVLNLIHFPPVVYMHK